MNPYDRLQALIRNPNYLEDYQNYKKALKEHENTLEDRWKQYRPLSEEEKKRIERTFSAREERRKEEGNTRLPELPDIIEPTLDEYYQLDESQIEPSEEPLLDKYELNMLIDPDDVRKATKDDIDKSAYLVFRDLEGWPVRVIKAEEGQGERKDKYGNPLKDIFDNEEIEITEVDITPHLRDGRYLSLEIDLHARKGEDIKPAIIERIDEYLCYIEKEKKRNGTTIHNPWDIYDRKHDKGYSLIRIAKEISGINENPSYNKRVDAVYREVTRAYQKACSMIKSIS